MVAFTLCAGCATGVHENHAYWIQKPPEGVMGGFACRCSGPEECAGNGEKLLRALFGDRVITRALCCDLHNRNCEPPSELCCRACTEAAHPHHRDGSACIAPDLSGTSVLPPAGGRS